MKYDSPEEEGGLDQLKKILAEQWYERISKIIPELKEYLDSKKRITNA